MARVPPHIPLVAIKTLQSPLKYSHAQILSAYDVAEGLTRTYTDRGVFVYARPPEGQHA